jgi:hypothetical protein
MILYRLKNYFLTADIYEEKIVLKSVFWLRFLPWNIEPQFIYYKEIEKVHLMKSAWPYEVAMTFETHQGRRFSIGQSYRSKSLERIRLYIDRQISKYNAPEGVKPLSKLVTINELVENRRKQNSSLSA